MSTAMQPIENPEEIPWDAETAQPSQPIPNGHAKLFAALHDFIDLAANHDYLRSPEEVIEEVGEIEGFYTQSKNGLLEVAWNSSPYPQDNLGDDYYLEWAEKWEKQWTATVAGQQPPQVSDPASEVRLGLMLTERMLERIEANENTIERFYQQDTLLEKQGELEAELEEIMTDQELQASSVQTQYAAEYGITTFAQGEVAAVEGHRIFNDPGKVADNTLIVNLPPESELEQRAVNLELDDARFLGRTILDDDGRIVGYGLDVIELFKSADGQPEGRILDVGEYSTRAEVEQERFVLPADYGFSAIPANAVGVIGEQLAAHNGLSPDAWRTIDDFDVERYQFHIDLLDPPQNDVPPSWVLAREFGTPSLETSPVDVTSIPDSTDLQEQLETLQVSRALNDIGVALPDGFNLKRDSIFDEETGDRFVTALMPTEGSDSLNYQAMLLAISRDEAGVGLQAFALELGVPGSQEQAQENSDMVRRSLAEGGIERAIETIEAADLSVDAPTVAPEVEQIQSPSAWSRDID